MKKIVTAIGMLLSLSAQSQLDSLKTTHLQEIIFSAARTEQAIIDVPRSATVINSEVISKTTFNSVGELLAAQEGIYIVGANQTPGTNQSIFLRGTNANHVAVMIDGKRITDPSSPNAAVDLSELSLTNIDRIEIIRGSHTTVFGGAAVGGVINIITKKRSGDGVSATLSIQPAVYGKRAFGITNNVNLNYGFTNGFYANASVFQQSVKGLDASAKVEGTPGYQSADKDDFRKLDGGIKAGYQKEKWDAYVAFKSVTQQADIDDGAFNDDDNNVLSFRRNILDYQVNTTINDFIKLSWVGSWNNSLRINENDSSVIDESGTTDKSYFKGRYHGALQTHELQANYQNGKLKGVLGTGLFYEKMLFNTYYFSNAFGFPYELSTNYDSLATTTTTGYAFAKAGYDIGVLNLSGGIRLSNHSLFGNNITFEFNPSYRINDLLVFASISTGYNAPSLYQLFDPTKETLYTRGNKNLAPERSVSLEIGGKYEFGFGNFLTASIFRTQISNVIEYVYLWNGEKSIDALDFSDYRGDTYINIAQQHINGIELSTNYHFSKVWSIRGNATLTSGEFLTRTEDFDASQLGDNHLQIYSNGDFLNMDHSSKELMRRPAFMANAGISASPTEHFRIDLNYRYASGRYDAVYESDAGPFGALGSLNVDEYHLLDLGSSVRLNYLILFSGKVENLLDQKYAEIQGFNTRGRSFYLKFVLRIDGKTQGR